MHKYGLAAGVLALMLSGPAAEAQVGDEVLDANTYQPRGAKEYDEAALRYLRKERPKIVGGVPADEGEYPYQASLLISWISDPTGAHFCGASVLNERWVLTASHCLDGLAIEDFHVAAGANHLEQGILRINAQRKIMHKQYNSGTTDNDIALVELRDPLPLGPKIQPISLLAADAEEGELEEERKLWVTGWGATEQGGPVVKDLREVDVPFVTRNVCNDPLSYNGAVTENMICAGQAEGGTDSCQGDSGGPLVLDPADETTKLAGIVSWGEGCALPGKYGVYTRVARYGDWVEKCMANPDTCQD
ncbi:MAG: hypothetical protein QOD94_2063 [Alphaproteobacteria bacterium]|jgi:secreted trypsin-like serine protease|nr:hypothetical protein [Alphaproteobacteria bacterium]